MDKRELAMKLLEIDANISQFESKMQEAGVDVGNSDLQFVDIPVLVAEIYGVPADDRDAVWEANVFLDDTKESHERFIDDMEDYVRKYVSP